jgi:sugar transferase (PEP-CTERM/EpsH1 system associated)
LARYERSIAAEFSASVFVSAAEAEPVLRDAPGLAARIHSIGNGVDSDFFDPTIEIGNPFPVQDNVAVFTGAMDYWANVDAVSWFAKHVWSRVAREEPTARFCIVGARPTKEVRALERLPGVTVVGAVPDVRPYLKFASLAVAPLRVARGIQNKVLEALAMGLPVVATPAVGQGLSPAVRHCVEVADEAAGFASLVLSQIRSARSPAVAARNRSAVVATYDWRQSAREWARLLKVSETPTALPAAESAVQ